VFQVSVSSTETVGSAGTQSFDADVEVERGDRVGLVLAPGSAVGTRGGAEGATLARWLPPVGGLERPERGTRPGLASELLLRVGIEPGGRRSAPEQITGSRAENLPAGSVVKRRRITIGGRPGELRVVRAGGEGAIDALVQGRRVARIAVPELRARAAIPLFLAAVWSPENTGLDLSFVNEGSARVIQRTYVINADGFTILR
jgi:hypothetical protein